MKIFQIENNICFYDATRVHQTLESTVGCYPSNVLFVEAPDNVFEGWGYLNGEFIKPTPPEGWLYDENTGTFYLAPPPKTLIDYQQDALSRIDGMCSRAIYRGADVGTLHYNFTTATQTNLETIARRIDSGTTQVLYRADNESEQRIYPASEIRVVINTKDEWIAINTNYYELLKKWADREDDRVVLESMHYGSVLPDDLMLELSTRMAGVGIDISKYAGAFT